MSDQWRSVSVTIITSSRYTTRFTCLLSTLSLLSRRTSTLYSLQHFLGMGDLIFNLHTYNIFHNSIVFRVSVKDAFDLSLLFLSRTHDFDWVWLSYGVTYESKPTRWTIVTKMIGIWKENFYLRGTSLDTI